MKETLIWGKIPLKDSLSHEIVVQNKRLVFSSKNELVSFKIATSDSNIEDAVLNRVVGKVQEMHILPALPDRPVVLKPKTNLSILPFTTFKFYVYLPATFQLFAGATKTDQKIYEDNIENLSSTWFGEPSEGELCYALYTSFSTSINEDKKGNDFVICPIEVNNNSKEPLEIKRLAIRGIHLSIYANNELMISNKVRIKYN
nr:hypothetical protein [Bacteroidales bacterium]